MLEPKEKLKIKKFNFVDNSESQNDYLVTKISCRNLLRIQGTK